MGDPRATRTFVVYGQCPVPVGHRVEVTIFSRDEGLLRKQLTPQLHVPLVRDLDTGVAYGRAWHFARTWDGTDGLPLEPRDDLVVHERIVGRVLACRVLFPEMSEHREETTLVVAPEAPRSAHR